MEDSTRAGQSGWKSTHIWCWISIQSHSWRWHSCLPPALLQSTDGDPQWQNLEPGIRKAKCVSLRNANQSNKDMHCLWSYFPIGVHCHILKSDAELDYSGPYSPIGSYELQDYSEACWEEMYPTPRLKTHCKLDEFGPLAGEQDRTWGIFLSISTEHSLHRYRWVLRMVQCGMQLIYLGWSDFLRSENEEFPAKREKNFPNLNR